MKDEKLIAKADNYAQAKYMSILQTMEVFAKALDGNDKTTMNVKQYFEDMVFMLDLVKEMHRQIEELKNEKQTSNHP